MSRFKILFAVLVAAAIVGTVPQARATTPEFPVVMAGSSALWQTLALGAYNDNKGASTSTAIAVPPMFHWTGSGGLVLQDTRPQLAGATSPNNDAATVWVVYDSAPTPHIWVNAKVDSVVGDRCFFARPACAVVDTTAGNGTWLSAGANKISSTLWGDNSSDVTSLPGPVLAVLESTTLNVVNTAATDIRPEDAEWAIARVNSALGSSNVGGTNSDGLDGLGYNTTNTNSGSNEFPGTKTGTTCNHVTQAQGVGTPIYSALGHTGTSTDAANVLAFNISGNDPFSCTPVGAYTVKAVGAAPIVFVTARANNPGLKNLTNASEAQLQAVFSGTTNASAFGLSAAPINAYLREPLSGTYNTTEATVMRRPTVYPGGILGTSMETGVNPATNNPLNAGASCTSNCRYRGIGTGEVITEIQNSNSGTGQSNIATQDGISYAFFSYGNVKAIADSSAYGYIQLNGVDPIFNNYSAGNTIDPGQPASAGTLPGGAETTFPACENTIWGNGGFSFPNVRNGTYRAWSLLRLIYLSTQTTPITDLVTSSNKYAVGVVPDYVPVAAVTLSATTTPACATTVTDLGLKLLRSHYVQQNGDGFVLAQGCTTGGGVASNAGCKAPVNEPTEEGGDMGGMIIPSTIGVTLETKTQAIQSSAPDGGLGPVPRSCPTGLTCPN